MEQVVASGVHPVNHGGLAVERFELEAAELGLVLRAEPFVLEMEAEEADICVNRVKRSGGEQIREDSVIYGKHGPPFLLLCPLDIRGSLEFVEEKERNQNEAVAQEEGAGVLPRVCVQLVALRRSTGFVEVVLLMLTAAVEGHRN